MIALESSVGIYLFTLHFFFLSILYGFKPYVLKFELNVLDVTVYTFSNRSYDIIWIFMTTFN